MHVSEPVPSYSQRSILFQALAALAAQPHRYRQFIDAGNQPTPLTSAGIVRIRHRGSSASSRQTSLSFLSSLPAWPASTPGTLPPPSGQIPLPRGSQSVNTFTPPFFLCYLLIQPLVAQDKKPSYRAVGSASQARGGVISGPFSPLFAPGLTRRYVRCGVFPSPLGPGVGDGSGLA
jgi:hypothetical protein